mgnify:CR=1 FL=1
MSDEETTENQIPEETSLPQSPQAPTEQGTENTAHSEPSTMPSEAPEAPRDDFEAKSNDIPPSNSTLTEPSGESKPEENSAQNEPNPEPVSEPMEAPEPETAQMGRNEPLETKSKSSLAQQLLISARNAIQFRKRKKLDKIMSLFLQQSKITNDEVEKLLHVSDATATRYLSQLEKEGKIQQNGKTGKGVSYSKI